MIVRIIAVDPHPRKDSVDDIVVWQVPEKSRAAELLTELLDGAKIEHATISKKEPQ